MLVVLFVTISFQRQIAVMVIMSRDNLLPVRE